MRLRPVRPVPSGWHEMPGQNAPRTLRPVGAVLSRTLRVRCELGVQRGGWVGLCFVDVAAVSGANGDDMRRTVAPVDVPVSPRGRLRRALAGRN